MGPEQFLKQEPLCVVTRTCFLGFEQGGNIVINWNIAPSGELHTVSGGIEMLHPHDTQTERPPNRLAEEGIGDAVTQIAGERLARLEHREIGCIDIPVEDGQETRHKLAAGPQAGRLRPACPDPACTRLDR